MARHTIAIPKEPCALDPKAWGEEVDLPEAPGFEECGEYAVVRVCGELFKSHPFARTYDGIISDFQKALDSDCPKVCLRVDSPGGDFQGALEAGRQLREMASKAKKPFYAFTDTRALSAAYAIICGAGQIVITPSAFVGSVGVWAPLVDTVAQDKAAGLNIRIMASGSRKIDKNPHVPISEGAEEALQSQVDAMAGQFWSLVARFRGRTPGAISALEGAEFYGEQGIRVGLADKIVNSWGEWVGGILASAPTQPQSKGTGAAMAKAEEEKKEDTMMGRLAKAVEEGPEEDRERAKRALRAWMNDPKKEEGEAKGEARDSDGDNDGDAESKKAKSEADEAEAKAKASAPDALAMVIALQKKITDREEADAKAALLATRPDVHPDVKAFLITLHIDKMKEGLEKMPKSERKFAAAAAAQASATVQGNTQGNLDMPISDAASAAIARMGGGGVQASTFTIGNYDVAAARKHLDAQKAGN